MQGADGTTEVKSLDHTPKARIYGSQTVWDTVSIEWKHVTFRTDPKTLYSVGSEYFRPLLDSHAAAVTHPFEIFHFQLPDDLFRSGWEMEDFFIWMLRHDASVTIDSVGDKYRVIGEWKELNDEYEFPITWLERFTHLANYFHLPHFSLLLNELIRRGEEIYPPDALNYARRYHSETLHDIGARGILVSTREQIAKFDRAEGDISQMDRLDETLSSDELRRCVNTWHKHIISGRLIYTYE